MLYHCSNAKCNCMSNQEFTPMVVAMEKKSEAVDRFWFYLAKFGLLYVSFKFTLKCIITAILLYNTLTGA